MWKMDDLLLWEREYINTNKTSILVYWNENNDIGGALVSVHYKHVVAKSNRLKVLLAVKSKSPNESIRGAKFIWEMDADNSTVQKHVFTHYVPLEAIEESIKRLKICAQILQQNYKGKITSIDTENINSGAYSDERIAKSVFLKVIVDAHYVEKFKIDYPEKKIEGESIVTIYKTDIDTSTLLGKFGIDMINAKMIDETTLRLTPDEIELLMNNAPYLIAMSVKDFSEITREEVIGQEEILLWQQTDRLEITPELEQLKVDRRFIILLLDYGLSVIHKQVDLWMLRHPVMHLLRVLGKRNKRNF